MSSSLTLERRERVAVLALDRPPLQILDLELLAELERALAELAGDATLQLLLVTATGETAFSAGVSVQDHTPDKLAAMLTSFHGALGRLRGLDALTVALVDGHCLGGGMELACCCDQQRRRGGEHREDDGFNEHRRPCAWR